MSAGVKRLSTVDCVIFDVSQAQLTVHESTLTLLKSERDELAEEKSGLEEELTVLNSQTHELQVE